MLFLMKTYNAAVYLNADHFCGLFSKRLRECAEADSNLDHNVILADAGCLDYGFGGMAVYQEILAEPFFGGKAVFVEGVSGLAVSGHGSV